jgi:hypothetical protein
VLVTHLGADRFPAASGARAGMTMEEAMSRNAGSVVLEADVLDSEEH